MNEQSQEKSNINRALSDILLKSESASKPSTEAVSAGGDVYSYHFNASITVFNPSMFA